ncbi:alpha/beta hydrolase [Cryobacterium algoritolerans]|uniref:Alpha/beta hydrolase n=1 Tax=Cryobacterium algoritolerans TaxID=1259184 RepID=A0A4R8WVG0_9MICO|nr:alpha/beta hydrolase [Cryobacterium algoritolerans]TFC18359.1 alpha/beta hydrolase [Cryobacterium algoritolerans]
MFQTVHSADGTTIAYEKTGTGPAVIVVGGAFNTRMSPGTLVPLLAAHFTVYVYDRRGRGDSTNTQPYAIAREIEDLAALIDAAGGSAMVYGHSSGAVLALEATAAGLPIAKVVAYEPPFTAEENGRTSLAWADEVRAAADADDREKAATLFLLGIGAEPEGVAAMTRQQWWPGMLGVAHTLPYDLALVGDGLFHAVRLGKVAAPTLLIDGAESPSWAGTAVSVAARAIPGARRLTLDEQDHNVDPAALAPALIGFFA